MTGRRLRRLALAACIVLLASLAAPPALAASPSSPSDWWYQKYGVTDVQAQGWTGAGVKVAVIDGQINPDLPVFHGANLTVDERPLCKGGVVTTHTPDPTNDQVHGSDVTALLIGNGAGTGHVRGIAPKADVTFYGYGVPVDSGPGVGCRPSADDRATVISDGIERAVADGARVISISQITDGSLAGDAEVIANALAKGVVIVAGVPNTQSDPLQKWPWLYNGVVAVNAFGADGRLQDDHEISGHKDVWPGTTVVAPGVDFASVSWGAQTYSATGSSLATPLTAGILAVTAQKYPHATGDQLIQSLIHNTTPDDHELSRVEDFGYGPVSLRHMLRVDPQKYPDENPLMDKSSGTPTTQQVAAVDASATTSPAPSASRTASAAAAAPGDGGSLLVPIVGGVIVALLVIGVIVLIVVINARRRKSAGGAT